MSWRGTLRHVWHLSPDESLDLATLPLPDADWPSYVWRDGKALEVGAETRRVHAGVAIRLHPHPDFEVSAEVVQAAWTDLDEAPDAPMAFAACLSCLLVGVAGMMAFGGALSQSAEAATTHPTLQVAPEHFVAHIRAFLPPEADTLGVTAPAPAPATPSPVEASQAGSPEDDAPSALRVTEARLYAFLDAAFEGDDLSTSALVDAYLAVDAYRFVRTRLGDADFGPQVAAMRTHLEQVASSGTPNAPVPSLATVTAALVGDADVAYHRDRNSVSDVLVDRRLNCQGGSVAVALALLLADLDGAGARPVFVHTPGHVQPGLLDGEQLHVVESTHTGARVGSARLADLRRVRVVDARLQLVSMLADLSPRHDWDTSPLADGLVLLDRLPDEGSQRTTAERTMPGMRGATSPAREMPDGDLPRVEGGDPLAGHRTVLWRGGGQPPRYDIEYPRPSAEPSPAAFIEPLVNEEHRQSWLERLKRLCSLRAGNPDSLAGRLVLTLTPRRAPEGLGAEWVDVELTHDTLRSYAVSQCILHALRSRGMVHSTATTDETRTIDLSWP